MGSYSAGSVHDGGGGSSSCGEALLCLRAAAVGWHLTASTAGHHFRYSCTVGISKGQSGQHGALGTAITVDLDNWHAVCAARHTWCGNHSQTSTKGYALWVAKHSWCDDCLKTLMRGYVVWAPGFTRCDNYRQNSIRKHAVWAARHSWCGNYSQTSRIGMQCWRQGVYAGKLEFDKLIWSAARKVFHVSRQPPIEAAFDCESRFLHKVIYVTEYTAIG